LEGKMIKHEPEMVRAAEMWKISRAWGKAVDGEGEE
jgi:hypothetical protein